MAWYVVRSATRMEPRAEASLRELGLNVYLPCETRWRRHAHVKERVARPLFPGYLFVDLEPADFYLATRADGVHKIMGLERRRETVNAADLAWLFFAEHMGAFNRAPWTPEPIFKPGRLVRITKGHFAGVLAEIKEARGSRKFAVAFEWFGRSRKAELPVGQLAAA